MNEQTAEIIKALAIKFGTTSEYLWAVMIKQAPITALTKAFIDITLIIGLYYIFKFICKKTIPIKGELRAEWGNDPSLLSWFILCVYIVATIVTSCFSFIEIITGLFNPEYWALMQILGR